MDQIGKVTVVGAGFMGLDIALTVLKNTENKVALHDNSPDAIRKAKDSIQGLSEPKLKRITFHEDLASALRGADLVIEAIPEDLELKRALFRELDRLSPPKAILGTNSSSFPVSWIEGATQRADRLFNIHFYPPIEQRNMVDVMGGTRSSEENFQVVSAWVRSIGCVPLRVKKETIGFCFNRVWHMTRLEAMKMVSEDRVDFMDIDRAWMVFTNSPMGPFALMDYIGLDVVYAVHQTYYREYGDFYKPPNILKEMVDRGDLGLKTGKGFYSYPDPAYSRSDFLKP